MTVRLNSGRLLRSGRNRPCPVCGRVHDADCSFTADRTFVLCHHARTQLVPTVDGENGYLFTGNTVDGRCGVFVLDEYERRQW